MDWVVYAVLLVAGLAGIFLKGENALVGWALIGAALLGLLVWLAVLRANRRNGTTSTKG